jgi:hypothetical protein
VPYQLHCVAQADDVELLEEVATELDVLTTELTTELFELEEELGTLLGTELLELDVVATELLLVAEQTAPVIVGFSAGTPLVSP